MTRWCVTAAGVAVLALGANLMLLVWSPKDVIQCPAAEAQAARRTAPALSQHQATDHRNRKALERINRDPDAPRLGVGAAPSLGSVPGIQPGAVPPQPQSTAIQMAEMVSAAGLPEATELITIGPPLDAGDPQAASPADDGDEPISIGPPVDAGNYAHPNRH